MQRTMSTLSTHRALRLSQAVVATNGNRPGPLPSGRGDGRAVVRVHGPQVAVQRLKLQQLHGSTDAGEGWAGRDVTHWGAPSQGHGHGTVTLEHLVPVKVESGGR